MRKKCRRKVWSTNIDIIAHAIAGARITDETALNKIRLRELSCLDAMRLGKGTVEDWRVLVDMLNVTETFGKSGIGPECLDDCQIAQESLFKAAKRYESTKLWDWMDWASKPCKMSLSGTTFSGQVSQGRFMRK